MTRANTGRLLGAALTAWLVLAFPARPALRQVGPDGVTRLLQRFEQVIIRGDPARFQELVAEGQAGDQSIAFARSLIFPGATRVVVRERDRSPLAGAKQGAALRLVVEVFAEFGSNGRLCTCQMDVVRKGDVGADEWVISAAEVSTSFGALQKLDLTRQQYAVKDLVLAGEDIEIQLPDGTAFAAQTDDGMTALVLLGKGQMVFRPAPRVEREQMKLFAGAELIDTAFSAAFVRFAPGNYTTFARRGALVARPTDGQQFARAAQVFREDSVKSFQVNLGDLTTDNWSIAPGPADVVAEIHTKRFGVLTYARAAHDPEDVSLFDRARRRNIALYTSAEKLAQRGRFYADDERADYDVVHYDIAASFDPIRQSLEGTALLTLVVRNDHTGALTLRLSDSLDIQLVRSREFGRLFAFRVRNQNSFVITLPKQVSKGTVLGLTVRYRGRLAPQRIDREAIQVQQIVRQDEAEESLQLDPVFLYSNRSFWYPQGEAASYATATVRVRVPRPYACVASGDPSGSAVEVASKQPMDTNEVVFRALQPVRYLSLLVSRLLPLRTTMVGATISGDQPIDSHASGGGAFYRDIELHAVASPQMRNRAAVLSGDAIDIIRFYASLLNDCPYPSLTLAVVEQELPGGHSPAYLAVVSEQSNASRLNWRSDPTSFADFPEFFLAHELAHQWWGQAVGWQNYHEQWLSEGLAQYFAAMYAERSHGTPVFAGIIRRMQEWAVKKSDQGPVYLGYRVGHIKHDAQVFRAIVYNKSAGVLHMLRRLIGDEAFFRGLRRFYAEWRFRRAGSDDLRKALEAESGRSLSRFFDQWIYDSRLPRLRFSSRVEPDPAGGRSGVAVVRFDQLGEVFDVPVTVTVDYVDRPAVDVVVPVTEASTEVRIPLEGRVRVIEANRDQAALAKIDK